MPDFDWNRTCEGARVCLLAIPLHRALGHREGEAHSLDHLGEISASLNQPQKALEYYNQALTVLPRSRTQMASHILRNIGSIYAQLGQSAQALDYYARALPLARAVGARGIEASILAQIARVERNRGNLIEARSHTEAALGIIESVRTQIASPALRSSFLASRHYCYDLYVDPLVGLHERHPSEQFDDAAPRPASAPTPAVSLISSQKRRWIFNTASHRN